MANHARIKVLETTPEVLLIKDVGPWDQYLTVTNDAEWVVEQFADHLDGRRLEYIDSEGRRDQLLVAGGRFAGFAPAGT